MGILLTIIGLATKVAVGAGSLFKTGMVETTVRTVAGLKYSSSVMKTAMSHNVYWWAWGLAAIPAAFWFGWGMFDTICHSCLPIWIKPHPIPVSLEFYFQIVWKNIFWTGAAGYGIHTAGTLGQNIINRIFK
jgi:hypothetical protein